jgi:hypothetical protein
VHIEERPLVLTKGFPVKSAIQLQVAEPLARRGYLTIAHKADNLVALRSLFELLSTQINMNESSSVSACVNPDQAVLRFVETLKAIELRSL